MGTVIERLEALVEKHCEVDWDEDDLSELHADLPGLLEVARATRALLHDGYTIEGRQRVEASLEPLFREVPS